MTKFAGLERCSSLHNLVILQEMPFCVQISFVSYCFKVFCFFIKLNSFDFRLELNFELCVFTCSR